MPNNDTRAPSAERTVTARSGFFMLALGIALILAAPVCFAVAGTHDKPVAGIAGVVFLVAGIFALTGLFTVAPNTARVLLLFGAYKGTVRETGFRWTNPFMLKRSISLRARNLNGEKLKVNDLVGNPIEIAAVVVWRVRDTAQAVFDVDNFEQYVAVQSETAVRHLAASHPYDGAADDEPSLRGSTDAVADLLAVELHDRLARAGVEVLEARLSHLAYAPEIAGAMLRRQQAAAIIAARQKIVEGAVGMVEMALDHLAKKEVVHLDDERKAAMVSNLLVVLCSEQAAQPVVNSGTLYT